MYTNLFYPKLLRSCWKIHQSQKEISETNILEKKRLVMLLAALLGLPSLGKRLKVISQMALKTRDVDRVGASDGGLSLSGVHGLDVGLRVVGVEFGNADCWETGHVDSLVGVDSHLGRSALVSGRHAGREFGLDVIVASPEVGLAALVGASNGCHGGDCCADEGQGTGGDGLSEAECSDDRNSGSGE